MKRNQNTQPTHLNSHICPCLTEKKESWYWMCECVCVCLYERINMIDISKRIFVFSKLYTNTHTHTFSIISSGVFFLLISVLFFDFFLSSNFSYFIFCWFVHTHTHTFTLHFADIYSKYKVYRTNTFFKRLNASKYSCFHCRRCSRSAAAAVAVISCVAFISYTHSLT